jgi:hypothetical protein
MKTRYDYTQSLLSFRGRVLELVSVAFFVALGANLISSGLVMPAESRTWYGWPASYVIAVGSALALLGLGYIILRGRLGLPRTKNPFTGMLLVTEGENNTVAVDGYDFSEKITQYFAGLSENTALKSIWQTGDLHDFQVMRRATPTKGRLTAPQLVREAVEYFVLQKLSLHLSGHFENNPEIADKEIERFGREDIPKILLQNHFLELFSRPMVERAAFSQDQIETPNRVVFQIKPTGEIFEHFELILPAKSTVTSVVSHY